MTIFCRFSPNSRLVLATVLILASGFLGAFMKGWL